MQVSTFNHNGVTFEFKPPIEVPNSAIPENLGQLAGYAIRAGASPDLPKEAADKLQRAATNSVNIGIARKPHPNLVLATLQDFLSGKHEVSIR